MKVLHMLVCLLRPCVAFYSTVIFTSPTILRRVHTETKSFLSSSTTVLCSGASAFSEVAPSAPAPHGDEASHDRFVSLEEAESDLWERLYSSVDAASDRNPSSPPLLCLQTLKSQGDSGYRGVYTNRPVSAGDSILSIPLSDCLRDDDTPFWLQEKGSSWATRLAACLLDKQTPDAALNTKERLWLSLLPEESFLKATLPVHWPDDTLRSAASTALELEVDHAYFARAAAVQDLFEGLQDTPLNSVEEPQQMCQHALDVVQTRSCRVTLDNVPVRLLAPVFDFINHSSRRNCEFDVVVDDMADEARLCVTALRDIEANEEILIDYGTSARPSSKCLASYGFVPEFSIDSDDDEEHIAEVYMNGKRYQVGAASIPQEMVADISQVESSEEVNLTAAIAVKLAGRISEVAFNLLLDPWNKESGKSYEADESPEETAQEIISRQLAASLRFSQHRILLACSLGLRDWADEQDENAGNR